MPTVVTLQPAAPFRLDLTVWALRRRPRNAIDLWDGARYSRVFAIDGAPVRIVISQTAPAGDPELQVLCVPAGRATTFRDKVRELVERLLGLNISLAEFYKKETTFAPLKVLVDRFRGFRPPRFPTVFEAAVNAVCCQQLSLEVGIELLNRLAAAAGPKLEQRNGVLFAFPEPGDVARLSEARLRELGFSAQKAATLLELARTLGRDETFLEKLERMDNDPARARLLQFRGIGRWSAEYILLRGLGRLDVFPADDIAAQKSLRRWLDIDVRGRQSPYERIHRALRNWHPYEGLVYFHLLLANLAEHGWLKA